MIHRMLAVVLDVTPGPTPPAYDGDPNLVTPGVVGFVITFAIAAITVLLVLDMVRRIRRVRYRAAVQDDIAAEVEAAKRPADSAASDSAASDSAPSDSAPSDS